MGRWIELGKEDLSRIPKRKRDAHKGSYKKLLVAAGSAGMSGAAYLCAFAAYRTGAGLVKILSCEENRQILQGSLPEAIVEAYDEAALAKREKSCLKRIEEALSWADFVVLGPGLGRGEHAEVLTEFVLKGFQKPTVLDADGLNLLSSRPDLKALLGEHVIVTPHPKEMARLSGESLQKILADPASVATDFTGRFHTITVLKLSRTIIVHKDEMYRNLSGSPALAKAGSGDVLSGVIAGLLCLGLPPGEAAALGVYLHGLAGERAGSLLGEHGAMARDVIAAIPDAIRGRMG